MLKFIEDERTSLLRTLLSAFNPLRAIKWAAYVVVCCMVWMLFNRDTLRDYFQARTRQEQYTKNVARLQRDQSALLAERAALQAGGFPKEKALRERLVMVKPGEEILFIEAPDATPSAARDKAAQEEPSTPE